MSETVYAPLDSRSEGSPVEIPSRRWQQYFYILLAFYILSVTALVLEPIQRREPAGVTIFPECKFLVQTREIIS